MQPPQRRSYPIRLIITSKTLKRFCQDRADQCGTILVEESINTLPFRGARTTEERDPNASVN